MMMMMMKMKKETRYVTVEELDALARERLATHYALETARFSFASEDVRNENRAFVASFKVFVVFVFFF